MNSGDHENPWSVDDIEEFLYFCCPECEERNQSKELFLQHAFNQHPKAKECLQKLTVKEEPNDGEIILNNEECTSELPENFEYEDPSLQQSYEATGYDNYDIMKCVIKEEYDEELSEYKNTNEDPLNVGVEKNVKQLIGELTARERL